MENKKLEEGTNEMTIGTKLITKGVFRWKADYEGAVSHFEKAGTSFKNAKSYGQARDAFLKAALCYENMNINFSCAKYTEFAAQMAKELKALKESVALYEKAAQIYRMDGSHEKSAETYVVGAKIAEEADDFDTAIKLGLEALDIYQTEDKEIFSPNTFRYTTGLMIKNNKLKDAINLYKTQSEVHIRLNQIPDLCKVYLSSIILNLVLDDYVSADQSYKSFIESGFFGNSEEGKIAAELLDCFETGDAEKLEKIKKKSHFKFFGK